MGNERSRTGDGIRVSIEPSCPLERASCRMRRAGALGGAAFLVPWSCR